MDLTKVFVVNMIVPVTLDSTFATLQLTCVGALVGDKVGTLVGEFVGASVGKEVGIFVGE